MSRWPFLAACTRGVCSAVSVWLSDEPGIGRGEWLCFFQIGFVSFGQKS